MEIFTCPFGSMPRGNYPLYPPIAEEVYLTVLFYLFNHKRNGLVKLKGAVQSVLRMCDVSNVGDPTCKQTLTE